MDNLWITTNIYIYLLYGYGYVSHNQMVLGSPWPPCQSAVRWLPLATSDAEAKLTPKAYGDWSVVMPRYPLVMSSIANWKMAIEIVDLTNKNDHL